MIPPLLSVAASPTPENHLCSTVAWQQKVSRQNTSYLQHETRERDETGKMPIISG